jgi:Fe2+ or Zn2+ uptake regulation protein
LVGILTVMMTSPDHVALPAAVERLRQTGLRVTAPRVAILDALPGGVHCGVDEIARTVRQRLGSLSTQAVYDILRAFTDAGLVRRVELAGSPIRYESRVGDNHHHLVCRSCGRTEDVDCAVGAAPCLEPVMSGGYAVDEAEVTFWGYCPPCRQRRE